MAVAFGDAKVTIRQGGEVIWRGTLSNLSSAPICSPSRSWIRSCINANTNNHDEPLRLEDYFKWEIPIVREEFIPIEEDNVFAPRKVEVECQEVHTIS